MCPPEQRANPRALATLQVMGFVVLRIWISGDCETMSFRWFQ